MRSAPLVGAAYYYNRALRKNVGLPLIRGCGFRDAADIKRYLDIGADAVSLCTLALRNPGEAERIIAQYNG